MIRTRATFALAATLLPLAGCAHDPAHYPSLAPRPIEKLGFAEPESTPVKVAPDPALDAQLATMAAKLAVIAKGYATDAATAEAAGRAARGQPTGSERWIDAQTALAALDDWRAQSSSLLTDLEQLAIDRAAALQPDYPPIATLRAKIQAEVGQEAATIARIQGGG